MDELSKTSDRFSEDAEETEERRGGREEAGGDETALAFIAVEIYGNIKR